MKPGKHQRSNPRCHDLCWKEHDSTQSFVLLSYRMHELTNQHVFIAILHRQDQQVGVNGVNRLATKD